MQKSRLPQKIRHVQLVLGRDCSEKPYSEAPYVVWAGEIQKPGESPGLDQILKSAPTVSDFPFVMVVGKAVNLEAAAFEAIDDCQQVFDKYDAGKPKSSVRILISSKYPVLPVKDMYMEDSFKGVFPWEIARFSDIAIPYTLYREIFSDGSFR